ncbi:MAG: HpaII family restriction endonuclease [Saprospiraceae bacterium]
MLTGNKGEWSEIYVFLKLLADGKLNAADANLNVIPEVYYPIIKILREESNNKREYVIDSTIKIIDGNSKDEILSIPLSEFVIKSNELLRFLKKSEGSSFSFPTIEEFLQSIDVKNLTASKNEKSDISIVVHDLNTGLKPKLGFSIKSMLGKNSTLFNPGNTTNFIYEIINLNIDIDEINKIETAPKIANKIKCIIESGATIQFVNLASKSLKLNLQLIDSDLPKILAELLLIKYSNSGTATIFNTLQQVVNKNPLQYDLSLGHPFYQYKIKNFLTDMALGMTPSAIWKGNYDATGGIIIVKENGEIVCYYIYNRNEFQEYLLRNTRIEQASTSRYNFGNLYEENGKKYLKLNLQIRFN